MVVRKYHHLQLRIERIIKKLPDRGLLALTEYQEDRISTAYLIASAEFEYFLEKKIQKIMTSAYDAFRTSQIASLPIITLVHFFHPASKKEKIENIKAEFSHSCATAVVRAYQGFEDLLSKNHGFSEDVLGKLLLAISFESSDFSGELTALDGFAKKRGARAHQPIGPITVISPSVAEADIRSALQAVKTLHQKMNDIEKALKKLGI